LEKINIGLGKKASSCKLQAASHFGCELLVVSSEPLLGKVNTAIALKLEYSGSQLAANNSKL
jgi:hypothetical protein